MKVVSVLVLLFFCNAIYSQEYCERNAYCTDNDLLFSAPYDQAPASQGPDFGCLSTQPNPTFFELKITQSGSLAIVIEGKSIPSLASGQDVDFICWGPYPSNFSFHDCDSLTANYHLDCGNSASYSETLNIPNAVLGEIYVLMTSNVSNANQGILIKKIGGAGEANAQCGPPPKEICYGQFTVVQDTNGGNLTNPTFSIHPGAITNTTGMFIVSPTITTTYTLFSTGLNSQSVVTTHIDSVTITVYPLTGITLSAIQSKCTNTLNYVNLNVFFLPPTAATGYSIYWNPVPGSSPNYSQTTASNFTPGPNFVFIMPDTGCGMGLSFTMNGLPAPPVFTVSPPHPYQIVSCAYPTRTISASNQNLVYDWTSLSAPTLTGQVATFNNLSAGTWTVNGKDTITECITTKTIHISLDFTPPTSTLNPNYQYITCANSAVQTVTTTSTPSINIEHQFFWSNGLNVQGIYSNSAIISPPPGTHTYVLINRVNGCKTNKTFSVATSGGFPTFSVTSPAQNFSVGCAPKDVADIVIGNTQSSPPGQPCTYTILTPGASTVYGLGSQTSYTFANPGTYLVVVKDNTSGCESVSPFSIIQNTFAPEISVAVVTPTLSCYVPTVQLVGSSTNPSISYRWLYGSSGIEPGATYTVATTTQTSNIIVGTYTFEVRDLNNECRSTETVTIYQNVFPPIAKISGPSGGNTEAVSCKTPSLTLSNASTWGSGGNFPTPQGVAAIQWHGPSSPPKPNSTTYLALDPGTYFVTVQDLNNGCTSTTVFVVTDNRDYPVVQNPVPLPADTLDCGNQFARVEAMITTTVALNYEWFNLLGSIKQGNVSSTGTVGFALVSDTGVYRIVVTNTINGCVTESEGRVVLGALNSGFRMDKVSGYAPLTVTFNNESTSSSGSASVSSIWSFGNGNTQTVTAAQYSLPITQIYQQPGQYTVTLYTSKGAGSANNTCLDSTFKIISVDSPSKLEIPNVFTPNGDGSNDVFFVRMANLSTIKMSIYDRWGNLVYELENSNNGNVEWNGLNQYGKEVAEGTYFYIVTATGKDGKAYDTKGSLSLFR